MANKELTSQERKTLLQLARCTIAARLQADAELEYPERLSQVFDAKRGCFVTLSQQGKLRGCIGTIEARRSLWKNVEENARNAAFCDPRFPQLTAEELPQTQIEISVLTIPQVLVWKDADDLKEKLKPGIHGVILTRGPCRSTFLPQVWRQLPDKEAFLECLCMKGCMEKSCWTDRSTIVEMYEVECFSEE